MLARKETTAGMGAQTTAYYSYREWAERLDKRFFGPQFSGRPVTLFVDDEVVADLIPGEVAGSAIRSLSSAVRGRLELTGSNLFRPVEDDYRRWKMTGSQGASPSLPLLALSVLAATRMAREDGVSSTNYYLRFRQLLDLAGRGEPRGYGETVPWLWTELKSWLNALNHGDFGISTIIGNENFANIGYALSQALFRTADRQRLTHFFQWIDLKPGEAIAAAELLALFRSWAPRRSGVHSGVLKMAESEMFADQLAGILETEAHHWDGGLRDEAGRSLGRILVGAQLFPKPKLALIAQCPSGFPDQATFVARGGRSLTLSKAADGWYGEIPVDSAFVVEALRTGLKLESGGFALEYKADRVVPLAENTDVGYWASTRQVHPGDPHWILADRQLSNEVASYLQRHAQTGWGLYERAEVLAPGWTLFRDVVINTAPANVPAELSRIAPAVRERPTLWGGLPLNRASDTYLWLGEPDLWIPASFAPEAQTVRIDDDIRRRPTSGKLQLSKLGLNPSVHKIQVGPSHRQFGTVKTLGNRQAAATGSLGYLLAEEGGRWAATTFVPSQMPGGNDNSRVRLSGASLAQGDSGFWARQVPPLLLPKGAGEYVLLGSSPGQFRRLKEPESAAWLAALPLYSKVFEVSPEFAPVWLIIYWRTAPAEVRLKVAKPPEADPAPQASLDMVSLWAQTFLSTSQATPAAPDLWAEYQRVSESVLA